MPRRLTFIVLGLLGIVALSLTVYHVKATSELRHLIDPTNPAVDVNDMYNKINALRQSRGQSALVINDALIRAAQEQADYISNTGIYAHVHVDGSSPESRALAAGYQTTEWCCSENTHRTQVGKSAWEFWNYSSSHYHNMINPKWTEIGIATSNISEWTGWVMVFGSGVQGELPPSADQPGSTTDTVNVSEPTSPENGGTGDQAQTVANNTVTLGETYRVIWGDTLSGIASRYGVTTSELVNANDITGYLIYAGQTLVIPTDAEPFTDEPVVVEYVAAAEQTAPVVDAAPETVSVGVSDPTGTGDQSADLTTSSGETHRVVWGDTLLKIAQRYNVSVESLIAANDIANRHLIISGQTLVIPS